MDSKQKQSKFIRPHLLHGMNWTWGCISMKNKDVDDLYEFVQKGTEVEIIR